MENQIIEIRLEQDDLGRKYRFEEERDHNDGSHEGNYPCQGCFNAIWNVDHFCCRKLEHGWDQWNEFYGQNVFPFEKLYSIAKAKLGRDIEYLKEGVMFYECESRNR